MRGRERRCALFLRTSVLAFRLRAPLSRVPLAALLVVDIFTEGERGLVRLAARPATVCATVALPLPRIACWAGRFYVRTGVLHATGDLRNKEIPTSRYSSTAAVLDLLVVLVATPATTGS